VESVPLTAQHAEAWCWTQPQTHRSAWRRPDLVLGPPSSARAPLTCRECGRGLHATLSPKGLRFFAHDAAAPDCSLAGETIAHRLLKAAVGLRVPRRRLVRRARGRRRRAGGPACWPPAPGGSHRMAWEAQLAQITVDELREPTSRMAASGVPVCWVTEYERPWIGAVPSIRLTVPTEPGVTRSIGGRGVIAIGAGQGFQPRDCLNARDMGHLWWRTRRQSGDAVRGRVRSDGDRW